MAMTSSTRIEDTFYDSAPRIVIWEMTRACALACRHCRAEAIPHRDPRELTTAEAFKLLEDVAACDKPLLVLTGGDPLMRDDIYKIVEYGTSLGLPVSVSPSATGRLTRDSIRRLSQAGVRRISLSLDATGAEAHDAFRGVKGSYRRTIDAVSHAREFGIATQINTTAGRHNFSNLSDFAELLNGLDIVLWSVFFVLPVGRAGIQMCLNAQETEEAFGVIYDIAQRSHFDVKTTEAPHYRRYVQQRDAVERRWSGIGDGRGFVFISHRGDVQPSGFLELTAGNVRSHSLLDLYRDDATMQRLRRPQTFEGKCGICEFRRLCGGSRARAFTETGNPFGSDPACSYVPAQSAKSVLSTFSSKHDGVEP